jgi:hypothetical protein
MVHLHFLYPYLDHVLWRTLYPFLPRLTVVGLPVGGNGSFGLGVSLALLKDILMGFKEGEDTSWLSSSQTY